jgi:hypothetical protein
MYRVWIWLKSFVNVRFRCGEIVYDQHQVEVEEYFDLGGES